MGVSIGGLARAARNMEDQALGRFRTFQIRERMREPERRAIADTVVLTREQKDALDRLYLDYYGKKVSDYWHRYYTAFTGRFDPAYIPELLLMPRFERFENLYGHYVRVFQDKNVVPLLAARAKIRCPEPKLSCVKGMYRDREDRLVSPGNAAELLGNAGEVFCKPSVDSNSGDGCFVARFEHGIDILSETPAAKILEQMGQDFVIQERLSCHESIRKLYAGSVNTFRVITYRWKNDILFTPVIMRIGRGGGFVDNAHAGGVFIAVSDEGRLHKQAFTGSREIFERHPDSQIVFDGYLIPPFPKVLAAAKHLHELIPQIGVVNWDFTIDEAGEPVLIEVNILNGGYWMPQIAHGKGLFGENTAEVLRWLQLMEHAKPSEREKFAFGKGV